MWEEAVMDEISCAIEVVSTDDHPEGLVVPRMHESFLATLVERHKRGVYKQEASAKKKRGRDLAHFLWCSQLFLLGLERTHS